MLKKIVIATGISLSLASPLSFGWGLPPVPGLSSAGSGSTTNGADVDKFLADGKASTKMINDSRDLLVMAVETKAERDKTKDEEEQIKAGLASGDKKAIEQQTQMQADNTAKIKAAEHDADAQKRLENLSADQKKAVVGAFGNLALGVLQQAQQLQTGQGLLQSAAGNIALASKLPELKSAISDMGSNVKTGGELVSTLPALFKSAKINVVVPTDTTSKVTVVNPSGF